MSILSPLRRLARAVLSEEQLGAIDYYRRPETRASWGGPFNGQPGRQAIFDSIIKGCDPVAILETGTFLGTTTEYMAKTGLQVFTIEGWPRNYGYCRARFKPTPSVTVLLGDSRTRLAELLDGPLKGRLDETLFFYLDAHWNDDLPLGEEIEIIYRSTDKAVCLIDDFQVPGDEGYVYDDYGPGKALDATYVAPLLKSFGLTAYYPVLPSAEEGGLRRGCVALAKDEIHGKALRAAGLKG